MEVNREPNRNKSNVGPAFTKYTLFLLNAIFVIASILIISSVLSIRATLQEYYDIMMTYGLGRMTEMWLAVGFILFMVPLFGLYVAFKESTTLANIYAVLMIVVFILQIIASVVSFPPENQAPVWVPYQLEIIMREYSDTYRLEIDWIQSKFQCCGINGPTDWKFFDKFWEPFDYDAHNNTNVHLLPVSCCENDSNYVDLMCERYHITGCLDVIYQIVSASVMLAGAFGFIFSVVQLSAIILGYYYTRILRNNKTPQYTQIWNTSDQRSSGYVTSEPPDYSTI